MHKCVVGLDLLTEPIQAYWSLEVKSIIPISVLELLFFINKKIIEYTNKKLFMCSYHRIPIWSQERWRQTVLKFLLLSARDRVAPAAYWDIISIKMIIFPSKCCLWGRQGWVNKQLAWLYMIRQACEWVMREVLHPRPLLRYYWIVCVGAKVLIRLLIPTSTVVNGKR